MVPNHMHGVLLFADPPVEAGHARPRQPLSTVVASFKSAVSKLLGGPIWRRSYWDRIIRGDDELHQIRGYIEDNRLRWPADPENPARHIQCP